MLEGQFESVTRYVREGGLIEGGMLEGGLIGIWGLIYGGWTGGLP